MFCNVQNENIVRFRMVLLLLLICLLGSLGRCRFRVLFIGAFILFIVDWLLIAVGCGARYISVCSCSRLSQQSIGGQNAVKQHNVCDEKGEEHKAVDELQIPGHFARNVMVEKPTY